MVRPSTLQERDASTATGTLLATTAGITFLDGIATAMRFFLREKNEAFGLSTIEWVAYTVGPVLVEPILLFAALYYVTTQSNRFPSLSALLPGLVATVVVGTFLGQYVGERIFMTGWTPLAQAARLQVLVILDLGGLPYWRDLLEPLMRSSLTAVAAVALGTASAEAAVQQGTSSRRRDYAPSSSRWREKRKVRQQRLPHHHKLKSVHEPIRPPDRVGLEIPPYSPVTGSASVHRRQRSHAFDMPEGPVTMSSYATCRREIASLHEFFVAWFTGRTGTDNYDRVERALATEFELVTPAGRRREYADIVDGIRAAYASREPGSFDIEIRNIEPRYTVDSHTLMRYEEWQDTPDGLTGRVSTVLFEADPDAPGDVVWLDLHETWLDGPESDET